MRDESGRILIKGFYDDVKPPSEAERAAIAKIPDVEGDLRREFQIAATEGEGRHLNELLLLPALNIRGIESGHVGEKASNTIQTEARASIDFRLVPDETPDSIKPLVERHIRSAGLHDCSGDARRGDAPEISEDRQGRMGRRLSAGADVARPSAFSRGRRAHDGSGARAGAASRRLAAAFRCIFSNSLTTRR